MTKLRGREDAEYTLAELAERSGVPGRTIRYYIARGVLAEPAHRGRGAAYTTDHLKQLEGIRRLQEKGLTLAEIERKSGGAEPARLAAPVAWWQYPVAEDVFVQVRSGLSPWRARQVNAALQKLAAELQLGSTRQRKDEEEL
jgi:DNA-binding transcriptional MerR regulator